VVAAAAAPETPIRQSMLQAATEAPAAAAPGSPMYSGIQYSAAAPAAAAAAAADAAGAAADAAPAAAAAATLDTALSSGASKPGFVDSLLQDGGEGLSPPDVDTFFSTSKLHDGDETEDSSDAELGLWVASAAGLCYHMRILFSLNVSRLSLKPLEVSHFVPETT